ncbi:LysR family transcriptional regulator [Glutamicibacter sp. PS]|uniref:LysR family transcriptional regulator n=1 Tax=Glutamicibacter sp. PS TaxID=3075634 RepID=UPI00283AC660|nr:LysR family transcriptional regulator [Glutamicibacter sp. PS]MDR4532033.1 LysR family transcriptional regulator [Glutamicibacter sp. PS]
MQLYELRILRELGERGSVAAVAEALYVTPSAVSQQLAALQRGFNTPLTRRRGRHLELTEAGWALAAAGTKVASAMADAESAVDAFLDDSLAPVSLSAFHSAGLAWFAPLMDASTGRAQLKLSDEDVPRADFPALTLEHDIVIAHRLPHDDPWPQGRVVVTELLTEPLDVAVSAHHPLASSGSISARDLTNERWISVHEGFPLAELLAPIAVHHGQPLDIAHRVNEFFVAATIVRTGQAIGLMPRYTMRADSLDGVVLLPLRDLPLARQIDALSRPEALHRRAVREVLAILTELCAAIPPRG